MAFAVLIAILVGVGQLGIRRTRVINETIIDITGKRSAKLELARRALIISNTNSRIAMEIVLVENRALVGTLLAVRSENSKDISRLLEEIERRSKSEKEKQLLSSIQRTRKPYIDSYLRAIHLIVDEKRHDEAEAVVVNETLPALIKYHAAWDEFVEFQKDQVDAAVKQSQVDYARARRLGYVLINLAVAGAFVIAVWTTRHTTRELAARTDAQKEVSRLNISLEERVLQRTRELTDANKHLDLQVAVLEAAANAIAITDSNGTIQWVNHAFTIMTGYSKEEVLGKNPRLLKSGDQAQSYYDKLWSTILSGKVWQGEIINKRKDGTTYTEEMTITPVTQGVGNAAVTKFIAIKQNITKRKVAEERIQFLAYSDALTGLPNRRLLQDRLTQALASARRQKSRVALLFLDLDKFKNINDSLGHAVGDLLLQEVAGRLTTWGREQDTVARVGGDEFLILLTGVKDITDVAVAAKRLMDTMIGEYSIQGHALNITCSLGVSIFPEHGTDTETLIKNADTAMYSAKESGRNGFRFFTEDLDAQAVERLTLENSLQLALDKKELFLVYQPQMDIVSGKIIGLEALLRWQHPKLGLVPPDKFIRIAENCGLIVPIGEWVLETACSQARKWHEDGLPKVRVAVNVSAVQFRRQGFSEQIRRVLHETGLAPQYLELELTESVVLADADVTFSVSQELKAMGVELAIDDFGTGYSSFSYLKQFRVGKLKIDRSFIRDVAVNPDDAAITAAIISMAKNLHLKVIAEGVENEAQMSFLRAHHCDEIQGYYFSKPLAVDKVADKLRGNDPGALVRAQASRRQSSRKLEEALPELVADKFRKAEGPSIKTEEPSIYEERPVS
jgi:diguanylate cyclase (GGDEF)-like protein/PAS domain S-box-containing protein